MATCNDISRLPPELARAERLDGVFFVDLPDQQQRETIWQIHLQTFEYDPDQQRPKENSMVTGTGSLRFSVISRRLQLLRCDVGVSNFGYSQLVLCQEPWANARRLMKSAATR